MLNLDEKENGLCCLCKKPKETAVRPVSGIKGLKVMLLCPDHVNLIADQQTKEKENGAQA